MHLLRQNWTTITLSYLGFDRIILTNFGLCKILPDVFWLVLGNINMLGLFIGCLFRKELILKFYFLHLNLLMM